MTKKNSSARGFQELSTIELKRRADANAGALFRTIREHLMHVINLTPHTVTIKVAGFSKSFEPSGKVARVEATEQFIGSRWLGTDQNGINVEIYNRTFQPGDIINEPEPRPGTIYIVSSLVLEAMKDRKDVFAPDTGPSAERDDKGRIISVCRLIGN